MDLNEAITKRRSVRSYLSKEIEFEKLANVLEAANKAPSAGNLQDWKFIAVHDKSMREKIANTCPKMEWIVYAPVLIVICSELEKDKEFYGERGEQLYALQNTAAATQNMLLAATAEGLGSCWVGAFDEVELKNILEIPKEVKPVAIVTLGYYEGEVPPLPKKDIEEVVFFGKWGDREFKESIVNFEDGLKKVDEMLKK